MVSGTKEMKLEAEEETVENDHLDAARRMENANLKNDVAGIDVSRSNVW